MASSPSHLLSLPREIRNLIYRYLSHEVKTRWRWNCWPISGNTGVATITLENAPYTSVSSACSRLHDEYKESEHFRNAQVTIALSLDEMAKYTNEDIADQEMNEKLLPKLKTVTVVLAKKGAGKIYDHLWFNVFVLSKELAARSPHLEMIKVVAHECGQLLDYTVQFASTTSNPMDTHPFFECPYDHLAELPLRKHEQVHQTKSHHDGSLENASAGDLSRSARQIVARTGVWIFASASVEALAWRIPDLDHQWRSEQERIDMSYARDNRGQDCGKDIIETRKSLY